MKIEMTISADNIDAFNTDDDSLAYAQAVKAAIEKKYPQANVSVDLADNMTSPSCWVDDDPFDEVKDDVIEISQHVWGEDLL